MDTREIPCNLLFCNSSSSPQLHCCKDTMVVHIAVYAMQQILNDLFCQIPSCYGFLVTSNMYVVVICKLILLCYLLLFRLSLSLSLSLFGSLSLSSSSFFYYDIFSFFFTSFFICLPPVRVRVVPYLLESVWMDPINFRSLPSSSYFFLPFFVARFLSLIHYS